MIVEMDESISPKYSTEEARALQMTNEKIRLVIADDNVPFRNTIKSALLLQEDMDIIGEAENGVDALEMVKTAMPDVVLLDAVMPRLDGIGVLERLREQPPAKMPQVILMNMPGQELIEAMAMESGAAMCICKPTEPKRLCSYIRACAQKGRNDGEVQGLAHYEYVAGSLLDRLRMSSRLNGYDYLCHGVALVCLDGMLMRSITTRLYPMTAERFLTTPQRVERCIRHAIDTTVCNGRCPEAPEILGVRHFRSEGFKPTNGEFIAMLADKVGGLYR